MRVFVVVSFIMTVLLVFSVPFKMLSAHPGSVGRDHCHMCYDVCEPYGLKWGQHHCHPDRQPGIPASIDASPGRTQVVPRHESEAVKPRSREAVMPNVFSGRVIAVSAGALLTVENGQAETHVELYGVVAPRKGNPLGKQAKRFTRDQVYKKTVTVIPKALKAGSVLSAQVILPDGQNLGHMLLQKGLVRWDAKTTDEAIFSELERTARTERRGLWAE